VIAGFSSFAAQPVGPPDAAPQIRIGRILVEHALKRTAADRRESMQITKIETFTYWIKWCNWLFVKVSTDEGLVGWGEGALHGAIASVEAAIHELGAALIGQDPAGVERHWHRMYHAWRWRGGPTLMTALGALDIAL
jgi:hypothetical protein